MTENVRSAKFRFFLFSMLGVFVFFIPVTFHGASKIPLVHLIDVTKGCFGTQALHIIAMILILSLTGSYIASRVMKTPPEFIKKRHEKDSLVTGALYVIASIFVVMNVFQFGPSQILHKDVGGLTMIIIESVMFTVVVAGWLVALLMEFGLLDFIGTLLEPVMRRLFETPGKSSVDALSSFVAAPAVGVYITNQLYVSNQYTEKEATSITTNFSVCSIGFFALLVSIGKIEAYFPHVILTSLVVTFLIAMIVIRIPPLSRKKDVYFDGTVQSPEERLPQNYDANTLKRAYEAGTAKAAGSNLAVLYTSLFEASLFMQKVIAYVISIAIISLLISTFTPFFEVIGKPMAPILSFFRLPEAATIAPATLIGISEIALPVIVISGKGVPLISVFFITVLSTVQIIFFTESANVMLESDMPISLLELIAIFIIRTAIAIPIVAGFAHLLF